MFHAPLFSALMLAAASPAAAQVGGDWSLLQSNAGPQNDSGYGTAVCFLDDLNGDGVCEILAGARDFLGAQATTDGIAEIRDGATGAILWTHVASDPPGGDFGASVARMGDLDGDGIGDYVISEPHGNGTRSRLGVVHAYSGATGTLLWRAQGDQSWSEFGEAIARIDDVTGDGVDDLLVGATDFVFGFGELWRGAAYVISGADGSQHSRQTGGSDGDYFGQTVGQLGDVNGDGVRDFGIGWRGDAYDTPGFVSIYSGANLRLLRVLEGPPTDIFDPTGWGRSFCSIGDIDGDGADETVVAAPWMDNGIWHNSGEIFVYSGRTGALMWSVVGDGQYDDFGEHVTPAGDLDGDGITDLAVTELTRFPGGAVHLLSGYDGRSLTRLDSNTYRDDFGAAIDASVDVDGDGLNEILIGAAEDDLFSPGLGRYELRSWKPMLRADARTASNSASGIVTMAVDMPSSEAGQSYSLLLSKTGTGPTSLGGVLVPLSQDQLLDRTRRGNPPTSFGNANGTLDGNGDATITFTWSAGDFVGEVGLTYWASVVSHDASGIRTVSSAMPLTITP